MGYLAVGGRGRAGTSSHHIPSVVLRATSCVDRSTALFAVFFSHSPVRSFRAHKLAKAKRESISPLHIRTYGRIHWQKSKEDSPCLLWLCHFEKRWPKTLLNSTFVLWANKGPVGLQGPFVPPRALWASKGPVGLQEPQGLQIHLSKESCFFWL